MVGSFSLGLLHYHPRNRIVVVKVEKQD